MRTGRPKTELVLSDDEPNSAIAGRLGVSKATVGKWRTRFIERRIAGLYDDVRPGKPRTIDDERVAHLIKTTLHTKPANGSTHWSVRTVAAETGISKTSVQRYFQLFGLQPHRTDSFKLSTDPFFIEKLRDVVGLYLSPPDNALVICVDEKSQCQALERTQPKLRRPQPPEDQGVAGDSPALAHALHPDLQLLAQPGRVLLLADHRQGHPPRLVQQRQTACAAHRSLRHSAQRQLPALQVDRHRRFHP